MPTGDLSGNLKQLTRELRAIRFGGVADEVGLRVGDPVACLPILHYTLLKFSKHVALAISNSGVQLLGKTDQRFVECTFKVARDLFSLRPVITPQQFLEQGFAERKILFLTDLIHACKALHNDEARKHRLASAPMRQSLSGLASDAEHWADQSRRQSDAHLHQQDAAPGGQGPRPAPATRAPAAAAAAAATLLHTAPSRTASDGLAPALAAAHIAQQQQQQQWTRHAAVGPVGEAPAPATFQAQHATAGASGGAAARPAAVIQQQPTGQQPPREQQPVGQQLPYSAALHLEPTARTELSAVAPAAVLPTGLAPTAYHTAAGTGHRESELRGAAAGTQPVDAPAVADGLPQHGYGAGAVHAAGTQPPGATYAASAGRPAPPSGAGAPPPSWEAPPLQLPSRAATQEATPWAAAASIQAPSGHEGAPACEDTGTPAGSRAASEWSTSSIATDGHPAATVGTQAAVQGDLHSVPAAVGALSIAGRRAASTSSTDIAQTAQQAAVVEPARHGAVHGARAAGGAGQQLAAAGMGAAGAPAASPELVQQLLRRLAAVEQENKQWRAQGLAEQAALQARITILEGKVRFLESSAAVSNAHGEDMEAPAPPSSHNARRHDAAAVKVNGTAGGASLPAAQHKPHQQQSQADAEWQPQPSQVSSSSSLAAWQSTPAALPGHDAAAAARALLTREAYGPGPGIGARGQGRAGAPQVQPSYAETVNLISTLASRYKEADHLLMQLNAVQK